MGPIEELRPTALPALAFVLWWPLFALLPARGGPVFFIIASVVTLVWVEGPWLALGLSAAILLGYALVEGVSSLRRGRTAAFAALLVLLHAGYWSTFRLPVPAIFAEVLRPADQQPAFVLFSGIGVTFFRLVSFAWDRHRGMLARIPLRDYLAYMLFFPQFRHGPIERCGPFAGQLGAARGRCGPRDLALGLLFIGIALAGLGVLALVGTNAPRFLPIELSNRGMAVLAHPEGLSLGAVLLLMFLPLAAIYLLESSFARLQLGVSRLFGVRGTENFDYPFLSRSPREVWRRWNITVSTWLFKYAYAPLGGFRRRAPLNILLVFVYCGLLHALQWRCVVWGLWTGGTLALFVWLVPHRVERRLRRGAWGGAPVRVLVSVVGWGLTVQWVAIGAVMLLDPDYCGLKFLARYVRLLTGG